MGKLAQTEGLNIFQPPSTPPFSPHPTLLLAISQLKLFLLLTSLYCEVTTFNYMCTLRMDP
jgi:hypothetical protein